MSRGPKKRAARAGAGPRAVVWTPLVYKLEESEEEVTVLVGVESPKKAGRGVPEVRAAKSFESRIGE